MALPDWMQAIVGHIYVSKHGTAANPYQSAVEAHITDPLWQATADWQEYQTSVVVPAQRQAMATPTDEPLWAPSETVPFISRTTGVPLSYTAGGGGAQAQPYQPAGVNWLIVAALAAWYLFG